MLFTRAKILWKLFAFGLEKFTMYYAVLEGPWGITDIKILSEVINYSICIKLLLEDKPFKGVFNKYIKVDLVLCCDVCILLERVLLRTVSLWYWKKAVIVCDTNMKEDTKYPQTLRTFFCKVQVPHNVYFQSYCVPKIIWVSVMVVIVRIPSHMN